jgi:DNA-directed RNA polymerase specialized sigma24 family protein
MDREVALREFVSARGAALSRAAFLLTGDHQAAEDLVQEAYVVLVRRWQKSGTVDPVQPVRGRLETAAPAGAALGVTP